MTVHHNKIVTAAYYYHLLYNVMTLLHFLAVVLEHPVSILPLEDEMFVYLRWSLGYFKVFMF
jgi:hypothetical protein